MNLKMNMHQVVDAMENESHVPTEIPKTEELRMALFGNKNKHNVTGANQQSPRMSLLPKALRGEPLKK